MPSLGIPLWPSYRHAMFLNVDISRFSVVADSFPKYTDAEPHDRSGLISKGYRHINGLM